MPRAKKRQQKIPILKKTSGLCPSWSYYSVIKPHTPCNLIFLLFVGRYSSWAIPMWSNPSLRCWKCSETIRKGFNNPAREVNNVNNKPTFLLKETVSRLTRFFLFTKPTCTQVPRVNMLKHFRMRFWFCGDIIALKVWPICSVAEPEPVDPKLFRDLEPEPKINLNKHFLQLVWLMLGQRKANFYLY